MPLGFRRGFGALLALILLVPNLSPADPPARRGCGTGVRNAAMDRVGGLPTARQARVQGRSGSTEALAPGVLSPAHGTGAAEDVVSRAHPEPLVSVVIPTRDRMASLQSVLATLRPLADSRNFEVIVVDDGSTEPTKSWLDSGNGLGGATVLHLEQCGPAAARNRGVAASRAPWVALLGDDTVPEPAWAAEITRCAESDPGADLDQSWVGHVRWHPRLRVTRFMEWIHQHGLQFGFGLIDDPDDPFLYHKTTNRGVYERARQAVPGLDDVLLWNRAGEITESTIANLVVETGGKRVTPPIRCGLLGGVFRGWLLARGEIEEQVVTRSDLASADRLWLINSVQRWMPARLVEP